MIIIRRQSRALLLLGLLWSIQTQGAWIDWWKTPEQQAQQAFESGDHDTLANVAPNRTWTGLGQFQTGDFPAASGSFSERVEELIAGDNTSDTNRARYNQGVSEVMGGRYQEAVDLFDNVLSDDPAFPDAEHNRNIAQQLLELQQQSQKEQPQDGGQGKTGDQGENGEQGESDGEQTGESQNSDSSEQQSSDSPEDDQANDASNAQNSSDSDSQNSDNGQSAADNSDQNSSDTENQTEAQRQQDAEDAQRALAAEAQQRDQQAELSENSADNRPVQTAERPLSEAEQAAEQLLRKIPDDPAGLLRRKLEQSHRNEYPEVRSANEPW